MLKVRADHSEMLGSAIQLFTAAPDRKREGHRVVKSSSSIACLMDVLRVQETRDSWFILQVVTTHKVLGFRKTQPNYTILPPVWRQSIIYWVQLRRFH